MRVAAEFEEEHADNTERLDEERHVEHVAMSSNEIRAAEGVQQPANVVPALEAGPSHQNDANSPDSDVSYAFYSIWRNVVVVVFFCFFFFVFLFFLVRVLELVVLFPGSRTRNRMTKIRTK